MAIEHIGLLGGSFDPVHFAHIKLALSAVETLQLDQLQLIPAANPWQRAPLAASAQQRIAMLEIACANYPTLRVNTSETERGGATYTIDTIRELPSGPLYYWIIGSDQLENFCSWRDWQEIIQRVELAVAHRPGSEAVAPLALNQLMLRLDKSLHYINLSPMNISATDIRHKLRHALNTEGLLDPRVAAYIAHHKLYKSA